MSRHVNAVILAAALTLAAAILSLQLFVPPIVGLADNGDYQRVMAKAGFEHTTGVYGERYFSFLRTRYAIVARGWLRGDYHSSETLLAFVARGAHLAFSKQPLFDIRLLGAIHAALLLLALAGIIRACRDLAMPTQVLVATLLVFVFTDVGYAAPFNSFYSQTASLLFLLLSVAIAAAAVRRGRLSGGWLLAYFACALLFVGSKPQERLAAPLLALFGMLLAGVRLPGAWRRTAVWLGIGLCAFSVWYGRNTPYTLRQAAIFQVVFDDLLAHSAAPVADARELRLDPDWVKYTGSNPYAPDSPLLDPGFGVRLLHQVGYRRDPPVLSPAPDATRRSHRAGIASGMVSAADLRQLREVCRASRSAVWPPGFPSGAGRAAGWERIRSSGSCSFSGETSSPRSRPIVAPLRGAGSSGRGSSWWS